jgi:hypothetical protein
MYKGDDIRRETADGLWWEWHADYLCNCGETVSLWTGMRLEDSRWDNDYWHLEHGIWVAWEDAMRLESSQMYIVKNLLLNFETYLKQNFTDECGLW